MRSCSCVIELNHLISPSIWTTSSSLTLLVDGSVGPASLCAQSTALVGAPAQVTSRRAHVDGAERKQLGLGAAVVLRRAGLAVHLVVVAGQAQRWGHTSHGLAGRQQQACPRLRARSREVGVPRASLVRACGAIAAGLLLPPPPHRARRAERACNRGQRHARSCRCGALLLRRARVLWACPRISGGVGFLGRKLRQR